MKDFALGMNAGMPVCVGYFSVSFGFGAMAVAQGLSVWHAILISATNLTSAGQFAGLTVIAAGAAIVEMILTQLVINSRYALMSLALGPRFGPSVGIGKRLIAAFFNTDEIFALGMAREGKMTTSYFVGAGTVAALGWIGGTAMGALAKNDDLVILNFSGTEGDFQFASEQERAENVNIGISVLKGNTDLKEAIDKVLSALTEEHFNAMMDYAIAVQPEI